MPGTSGLHRVVNQSRAAAALLRANVTRLDSPLKVNLCVTYRCNYRCRTCAIWQRKPTNELSTEELRRFVEQNDQVAWVDVTGGEIFLRQDIGEVLEYMARTWRRLAILHFPTNGYLTDRIAAISERVVAQTPAQVIVTVSLDGDEALNDEIRGVPGGYRRQIATFKALRAIRGLRAVLGMTLSKRNLGEFERTFLACRDECPDLRAEDFHLNVAQRSEHYYGNTSSDDVSMPPAAVVEELHRYRRLRGAAITPSAWVEHQYLDHLEQYLASGTSPMRCHALRSSCFIDPWGTVYPCISYTRALGSLRDTDMALEPIWQREETARAQQDIWRGRCPQCWTPCEAYQSILGNALRLGDRGPERRLPLA